MTLNFFIYKLGNKEMQYFKNALKESEILNVVNEEGELLTNSNGEIQTIARGPAHKYGVLHQTSNILLIAPRGSDKNNIRILLQKRSESKDIFPGAWTVSCGGHMGISIDPQKAVIREAQEELNLEIQPELLIPLNDAKKGFENFLKVWRYNNDKIIQMGKKPEIVHQISQLPAEIKEYIHDFPPNELPEKIIHKCLFVENFNREFCFYYLYVLSESEYSKIKFPDGEVQKVKDIELNEFITMNKTELTDSSLTLIENVPNLADIIKDAYK